MVLRAKGGEIRRHQQRIKQSIKGGGGGIKKVDCQSQMRGNHKNIAGQSAPAPAPPPVINKDRTLNS